MFLFWHSKQYLYKTCSELVFFEGNSMNNLSSYCGLTDSRIGASNTPKNERKLLQISALSYKKCGRIKKDRFFFLKFIFLLYVQVNLCQKLSFLNQLTHNMTRDCSLNPPKNTSLEHVVYKNCFCLFLFWHSKQYLYTTCSELVFLGGFNEQSLVILWVNWLKNESFWLGFTCMKFYV